MNEDETKSTVGGLFSLEAIAARWQVSRGTAQRILAQANAKPLFLTGVRRGVRRYARIDIERVERATQAK